MVLYADIHTILVKYYQSYLMALHIHDIRTIRLLAPFMIPSAP